MPKEIVIIGGNTAGCFAALALRKKTKAPITIYEKAPIFTKTCSGILTNSISKYISLPQELIINTISKVDIHFPNNPPIIIPFKTPDKVIDRSKFYSYLHNELKNNNIILKKGFQFIKTEKNTVILQNTKTKEIIQHRATHLIGADGATSRVAKDANLLNNRSYFTGIKAIIHKKHDNHVQLFPFFKELGWVSPVTKDTIEIGIVARTNPLERFKKFCEYLNISEPKKIQSALIPVNKNTKIETIHNTIRTYLIGDAAAQIKNTTAGGIVQSAIAANALAEAIITNSSYQKRAKKALGKELFIHNTIRKTVNKFTEKDWKQVHTILSNQKLQKLAANHSRDKPSQFLLHMIIAEPRIMVLARKVLI